MIKERRLEWGVGSLTVTPAVSPLCELQPMATAAGDKCPAVETRTSRERQRRKHFQHSETREKEKRQWNLVETVSHLAPQESLSCCLG